MEEEETPMQLLCEATPAQCRQCRAGVLTLSPAFSQPAYRLTQRQVNITVQKKGSHWWERLTKQEKRPLFLAPDFDRWLDESDAEMELRAKVSEQAEPSLLKMNSWGFDRAGTHYTPTRRLGTCVQRAHHVRVVGCFTRGSCAVTSGPG